MSFTKMIAQKMPTFSANIPRKYFFTFKGFDSIEGNKHFDLRKCDQRICDMIKLCRDISKMFDSCTKAMLVEISFG